MGRSWVTYKSRLNKAVPWPDQWERQEDQSEGRQSKGGPQQGCREGGKCDTWRHTGNATCRMKLGKKKLISRKEGNTVFVCKKPHFFDKNLPSKIGVQLFLYKKTRS
jgi:hypothetical protein